MESWTLRLLLAAGAFVLVSLCSAAPPGPVPSRGLLLVANKGDHTLGIIDPVEGKEIATVDEGGLALAAIQQLYRMVVSEDERVAALTQANRDKDEVIRRQAARIDQLQQLEQTVEILAAKLERIENGDAKASLLMASK